MAELGDALTFGSTGEEDGIHVEMLDYGYIETCKDQKILRGIVKVLKSGKEGLYPELAKAAEDRLLAILPDKERNRILKLRQQASPDEVQSAENEVDNWVREISSLDSRLRREGGASARLQEKPIRGQKREAVASKPRAAAKSDPALQPAGSKDKKARLSGYDFRAWEKFDVDAAVAEVDEEEAQLGAQAAEARAQTRAATARLADDVSAKRRELFDREMAALLEAMEVGGMSQVQMEIMAGREKAKGNECFRCGEHETAFQHYSRSIALNPSVPAFFTNRALVAIKLSKFETAEDDCTRALQLDPVLVKPWWLRGSARLHRGRCAEAILDYESALRLEPENKVIHDMLAKAMEKFEEVEGRPFQRAAAVSPASDGTPVAGCLFETTDVHSVMTWEELGVPALYEEVATGALREAAAEPSFTRIAIVDESDSEEEEEEGGGSPTRIPITCDDSDSEEEAAKASELETEQPAGFTRIAIADDSEEEEEGEDTQGAARAAAEELKAEGNRRMQAGDVAGAVGSYTSSLQRLAEAGPSGRDAELAVLNNRSFAHLKTKNYRDAISDASKVLAAEPQNLKALYRRALAYEGFTDTRGALADVDLLLSLDGANALALELKARLAPPTPAPSTSPAAADEGESALRMEQTRQAAMKLLSDGEYEAAIARLEGAVGDASEPAALPLMQLLMTAYRGLGQNQKVIGCASKILQNDKDNFRAILCRSTAYLLTGSLEKARTDALAALRMDPTNSEAMGLLDQIQQEEDLTSIKASSPAKPAAPLSAEAAAKESARLKDAGNDALGKEKFDMAIALYTEALAVDDSNMAALNNRALAYLKANRFIDAEKDATALLERESREGKPPNVKALYRRGLARKNIGGKVPLLGAQEDFATLLRIEPANKTAKSEKAKVEQLLSEMRYSSGTAVTAPAAQPSGASSGGGGFDMTARSTVIKKKDPAAAAASPPPIPSSPVSSAAATKPSLSPSAASPATPSAAKTASAATPGSSGRKLKEPVVPTEPPRSLYELERMWRGLKVRPDLFARYVTTFTKATFKNVFKEAMTPDLLSSILSTIRREILVSSPETAQRLLGDMTHIASFSMTMALLPAEDLATLREIFAGLRVHLGEDSEVVAKLIGTYGVSM